MNEFRTVVSVIIMILASIAGLFVGIALREEGGALSGAVLFALIAGIACIIYVLDNPDQ